MCFIKFSFLYSIDLEIRDNNGHVPLWLAILSSGKNITEESSGKSGFSSRLVERGSSPDAVNHLTGSRPIILLFIFPFTNLLKHLPFNCTSLLFYEFNLKYKYIQFYTFTLGDSLLHQSASSNNQPAGLFLIEHGALVNHVNKAGESPLHGASKNGLVELVDRLLKR